MAQEPVISETEVPVAPAETSQPEETPESGHESPMGAFVFGVLMLTFYFVYFFAQWYEIVVLRGGA